MQTCGDLRSLRRLSALKIRAALHDDARTMAPTKPLARSHARGCVFHVRHGASLGALAVPRLGKWHGAARYARCVFTGTLPLIRERSALRYGSAVSAVRRDADRDFRYELAEVTGIAASMRSLGARNDAGDPTGLATAAPQRPRESWQIAAVLAEGGPRSGPWLLRSGARRCTSLQRGVVE